ncbi:hypothetical protein HZS55_15220 [Halosimplex rubrum]|uniref:DUF7968 domain-containing protein n=1 Tax=Halosimplex rubrum TaxID=869889 RepID=A0A7D5P1T1_9EURY|nr:hypothetical protein [Halosimplex rubrum]QLH78557.1 hypothetical protein HZS55_15220 [Halosimplex rubrum]
MTGTDRAVNTTDPSTVDDAADRIVVSFRSPEVDADGADGWWVADSAWIVEKMAEPSYRRYLRWAHAGPVAVGEEWEEFVNCGCANPEDVILRVETVEGGSAMGGDTDVEVVPRKAVVDDEVAGASA